MKTIKVWDPLIRLFHWSLVISFILAYISAEEIESVHIWAGYTIIGLLIFRLIWGFIGSRHARFSDFIYSPSQVLAYLKSMLSGQPKRYLGHNPAGAVMIFALLISLSLTSISGLMLDSSSDQFSQITLIQAAYADDDEQDEWLEEVHEALANFTLFLVFLHIAGVMISSRLHDENLVKAMITGKKRE